jgi:Cu(I)/Ag(I) efflux system membrane protein CusA/SilA
MHGPGWVFQYAIEDRSGRLSLADLRALQDWNLRYALTSVPGVAEVASSAGSRSSTRSTSIPRELQRMVCPITRVMDAIRNANADVGAMVVELSEREYMVRGSATCKSLRDIENVVVGATVSGVPVRVGELGRVSTGPAVRRGIAELDGRGEAVGGIVVMRFGENALRTIDA